jgi:hypothetical protein
MKPHMRCYGAWLYVVWGGGYVGYAGTAAIAYRCWQQAVQRGPNNGFTCATYGAA